jgi:uncharacterized membrane protein YfcA
MLLAWPTLLALVAVGIGAGFFGALVGIGGGVILVPALAIVFDVDLKVAIATSLVGVVATSTAAGSVYVGRGLANMRIAMTLETMTTIGGIVGGVLAVHVSQRYLSILFSAMMLLTAVLMLRAKHDPKRSLEAHVDRPGHGELRQGWEERGRLAGAYFDEVLGTMVHYEAVRLWLGGVIAFVAGWLSGMLGVGGGFLKVPAMNIVMRVPLRVAAATSNVMVGVTAIASLFVYFEHGYVHPTLVAPITLGVVAGSLVGTTAAAKVSPMALRYALAVLLVVVAVQMGLRAGGLRVG